MNEPSETHNFTRLLQGAQEGDVQAEEEFCQLVNEELRAVARGLVRGQAQPTSLVNELFLRLFREGLVGDLKNRRYFFAVAMDQMRQIVRERIRKKKTKKRGGHLPAPAPFDKFVDGYIANFERDSPFDFEKLDAALERMKADPSKKRKYEVVNLRYFAGLTVEQTAMVLEVAERTVQYDWARAQADLFVELRGDES